MKKAVVLFVFVIFSFNLGSAALGISPASVSFDFAPGAEYKLGFVVISDDPDKEMEVYASGDLAEYVKLSRKEIKGGGSFEAIFKFPDKADKPGEHSMLIGVREKPSEEGFITTVIDIRAVVKVFVPYPGRYAEVRLSIPNGNINEEIPVEVYVINRGRESLNVNVNTRFFSGNGNLIYNMLFEPVVLELTQERFFRKYLNTSGYRAGNYLAEVVVDYGETIKINQTFRIGSLFVNITNFTDKLLMGGIQKFFIDIESMWNNDLRDVYADVNISDIGNATNSLEFRTPSIDLSAWGGGQLVGFLDTTNLEGKYNTTIILNYGEEKSFASGTLLVLKRGLNIVYVIVGIIAVIIVIVAILIIWRIKKARLSYSKLVKPLIRKKIRR